MQRGTHDPRQHVLGYPNGKWLRFTAQVQVPDLSLPLLTRGKIERLSPTNLLLERHSKYALGYELDGAYWTQKEYIALGDHTSFD